MILSKKVFLSNLGCKLNQAELEHMARRFSAKGFELVTRLAEAQFHVVNTCTVTQKAGSDSRSLGRKGAKVNSHIKTVLTGCHATSEPDSCKALPGVDLVVPNEDKDLLVEKVEEAFFNSSALGADPSNEIEIPYVPLAFGNSRALVKIEDGCNMRCSFCIIPFTRGQQTSHSPQRIVEEVSGLVQGGYEEVVITGVQISSYNYQGLGLYELTRKILNETEIKRIRLTSIAPWQFDHRLIELFSSGRICRHFHIALQSGCHGTLKRMRRPYTPEEFGDLLGIIRDQIPDVAITTDLIVGFPGETDDEFEQTIKNVRSFSFSKIHAFPYSPRMGTDAKAFPNPVHEATKKERMRRILSLAEESEAAFARSQWGNEAEVLVEKSLGEEGLWVGTTDNYLPVRFTSQKAAPRKLHRVRLGRMQEGVLQGTELHAPSLAAGPKWL